MPAISVLIKPSSGMCNMSCDYCFYCDETQKREQESYGFMTEKTLKNVIRRTMLRAEGAISYAFQGGEPTLRGLDFFKRAVEYQKQYNKNGLLVQNALQTNGLTLNEEWCRFLRENDFLVGVSVDGTKEVHDTYRHAKGNGGSTFGRICQSIELLEEYKTDFNILTVVNRKVVEHIQEIYAFYKEKNWHYQQYIPCLDPLGEPHGQNPFSIRPKEYGQFLIDLFKLWYADWKREEQPYIRQFENYMGILLGYAPEACDQRGSCGIQYAVEADGSVYPCDFYMTDAFRIGNFNESKLNQIDEDRRKIAFVEKSKRLAVECRECPYYILCRGGCQRNRDYNKETGQYNNYFCEGYCAFFAECEDMLKEIAAKLSGR